MALPTPQEDPDDDVGSRTVIMRPGAMRAAMAAALADDRVHYLVVVEGDEPGRRIELGTQSIVIGRSKPAEIVIPDALVSRNHCRVGVVSGEVFVTDLQSSNGTFLDGKRILGSTLVAPGERITVGTHVLEHEWRSRREVEESEQVDSDLENAKHYVRALLPAPISQGGIRTDWVLQPCARLGGDMFGYHFIDPDTFAIYLIDVSGHGTDAAMHAVSVMNVLRQHDLVGVDVRDPARMAAHLNDMFPMEQHGGMLLSLWYGVIDIPSRSISFASAGHHAAYLVGPRREAAVPLDVSNVVIGMMPGYPYRSAQAPMEPGSSLYVFSDGVFEVEPTHGGTWGLDRFVSLLTAPPSAQKTHSERIYGEVMAHTGREAFEDDFTLVVATLQE